MTESNNPASSEFRNGKNFSVRIGSSTLDNMVTYIKYDTRQIAQTTSDKAILKNDSESTNARGSEGAKEAYNLDKSFESLLDHWAQSCIGFLDGFPLFSNVAHFVNRHTIDNELVDFLNKESIEKEEVQDDDNASSFVVYVLGRQHLDYVRRQIEKREQFERAERALSKAQLLAIVAEYEAFIADILRLAISQTPESFIPSSRTVSASTIISGTDLDQVRASIIEDQITDLQRGSHVDVINTIFGQLKLSKPDPQVLQEFGEICLRRNTLTHANGVANKIYRSDMKKLGVSDDKIPPEGEVLVVNDHYVKRSISRVFQMGYFIGHQVWQHLKKEERVQSVKLIINHSHDFLVLGYTKICGRICEFGLNKKSPANEKDRAYFIVNLALSILLNEKIPEINKKSMINDILSRRDWSIIDSKFSMALCCLNEDYERFGELFDAVKDRDFEVHEFMSLAIFSRVRMQPIFKEKMLEHYGVVIRSEEPVEENTMRKDD